MNGHLVKLLGLIAVSLIAGACTGGIDCPINPPECCYNVLTGCQLFDMPQGCSCSDYGLSYHRVGLALGSSRGALSGQWSGILQRKTASCTWMKSRIMGSIAISDQNGRISARIPGYGTIRGRSNSRGCTAAGSYRPLLFCAANVRTNFVSTGSGVGRLDAAVDYSCGGKTRCTAAYSGVMQRVRR